MSKKAKHIKAHDGRPISVGYYDMSQVAPSIPDPTFAIDFTDIEGRRVLVALTRHQLENVIATAQRQMQWQDDREAHMERRWLKATR